MTVTRHILVVDDEPDIETLISQKFRRQIRSGQYTFVFTQNGAEALHTIQSVLAGTGCVPSIDMVLTDINMPVMDGLALLQKISTIPAPPKTVVVSAYSDIDNIRTAMNCGAFDFLTKPINFQDLVITLERTLQAVALDQEKLAQIQQAQQQLVQSEKLSSLGQMLASVAHEMNNPVSFIAGNLEPARDYVNDLMLLVSLYQKHMPTPAAEIVQCIEEIDLDFLQSDLLQLLDSLQKGADLIQSLAESLKNFARVDTAEKQTADIHEGIESALTILHSRLRANRTRPEIEIAKIFGDLPPLLCYPNQLNQVMMNLLANAIDALDEHNQGKSYDDIAANPNRIEIETCQVDEQWVRITIADNGPGMSEETAQKLFEPFYTTKPVGKGTGLGLAISHKIVTENHGGQLICQSVSGQGTQFSIELPVGRS